jgi:hypothetical protein
MADLRGSFAVTFGGIAGTLGLFLPMARVAPEGRSLDARLWGGAGIIERYEALGLALLCCFLALVLVGLWSISTALSRGKALAAALCSLPPLAISAHLVSRSLDGASLGSGPFVLAVGGLLAFGGAMAGLIRRGALRH